MPKRYRRVFKEIAQSPPIQLGEAHESLAHVQDYLLRFGYLKKGNFKASQLDKHTSNALAKYQRMNNRRATGTFNKATREQMTTHRCGLPDMENGLALVALCSWDRPELTFAFDVGTNDVQGQGEFEAIRRAFRTWESVVPLTFTEVATNDNPDIQIGWRPAQDPDFNMAGDTLAHADFPEPCSVVTNGLPKPVHFDDTEHIWRIGAVPGAFDVETVALHEIGHILGLTHSSEPSAVMAPSVRANQTKRQLQPDDIQRVQELYSP